MKRLFSLKTKIPQLKRKMKSPLPKLTKANISQVYLSPTASRTEAPISGETKFAKAKMNPIESLTLSLRALSTASSSPSTMPRSTWSLSSISGIIGMKMNTWKIPIIGNALMTIHNSSGKPIIYDGPNKRRQAPIPKVPITNCSFLGIASHVYGIKRQAARYVRD